MLLLSLTAAALASPCRALLEPTPHSQPDGPRCLTGAVATAMSLTELETTPTALAREVKVTPAGIDPFDIQLAGEALGASPWCSPARLRPLHAWWRRALPPWRW